MRRDRAFLKTGRQKVICLSYSLLSILLIKVLILNHRKTYDKVYKEGRVIEQITDDIWYEHFEVKGPPMISNRDFCIVKALLREKDGK